MQKKKKICEKGLQIRGIRKKKRVEKPEEKKP